MPKKTLPRTDDLPETPEGADTRQRDAMFQEMVNALGDVNIAFGEIPPRLGCLGRAQHGYRITEPLPGSARCSPPSSCSRPDSSP